jgi:hypothetical protein
MIEEGCAMRSQISGRDATFDVSRASNGSYDPRTAVSCVVVRCRRYANFRFSGQDTISRHEHVRASCVVGRFGSEACILASAGYEVTSFFIIPKSCSWERLRYKALMEPGLDMVVYEVEYIRFA